jgi:hypothetical protein
MSHQEPPHKLNKDKRHLCYSLNDFHKKYAKERKKIEHLSKKDYFRILKKIFLNIAIQTMKGGRPFNPKVGLGRFGIIKVKSNNTTINWKETVKHKRHILYKNSHTNGFFFRWVWEKNTSKCNFKNKRYYSFSVVPAIKKLLHEHIMEKEEDPYQRPFDALTQLPPYEN